MENGRATCDASSTSNPIRLARSRYYLRPSELIGITCSHDCSEQAAWLEKHRVHHRIGLHGLPIVRIADYRARADSLTIQTGLSEGERAQLEILERLFARPQVGLVYVVDEGTDDSPFKVGWSYEDAEARLASLQTGNPRPLRTVTVRAGALEVEQRIHKALAASRMAGEWFARTAETRRFLIVAAEIGYREALEMLVLRPYAARGSEKST